jgi:hypothetical protein
MVRCSAGQWIFAITEGVIYDQRSDAGYDGTVRTFRRFFKRMNFVPCLLKIQFKDKNISKCTGEIKIISDLTYYHG